MNIKKDYVLDLLLIALVAILYLINLLILKNISGNFQWFFVCYFNDFLCPIILLAYTSILLRVKGYYLKNYLIIFVFILCCSIVWEFVAPIFKEGSVTDVFDIVAYLCGGTFYWIIIRTFSKQRKDL